MTYIGAAPLASKQDGGESEGCSALASLDMTTTGPHSEESAIGESISLVVRQIAA